MPARTPAPAAPGATVAAMVLIDGGIASVGGASSQAVIITIT